MGRRGPKPRKEQAITQAALELFVERGVKGATTRAIASRARTTEGSLYRYFTGKAELAHHVLERCLGSFRQSIARALEGASGPRHRLRAYVRAHLEHAARHPLEHALLVQWDAGQAPGGTETILAPRAILRELLAEGIAAGVFHPADPAGLATFVAGGLGRAGLSSANAGAEDERRAREETLRAIERMVLVDGGRDRVAPRVGEAQGISTSA